MKQLVPGLSPAEQERLALLLEECGEVQQIIGKILRHGWESYHPNEPLITNRSLLEMELGHVRCAMDLLTEVADLSAKGITVYCQRKHLTVQQYLHHQGKKQTGKPAPQDQETPSP